MRLVNICIVVSFLLLTSCKSKSHADNANKPEGNPSWPTVTLQSVSTKKLYSTLRYGGYLYPRASYPVLQAVDAVLRNLPLKVGQYVKVGDPLYSFQQVLPGTSYGAGWALAQNTGYVSLINGVEGHLISKNETVLVISDFSSAKLKFFLSNQDADHVRSGQEVYLAEFVDEIKELDVKLKQRFSEEARARLTKQKEEKQALMEATKGQITRMPTTPKEGLGVFDVQVEFPVHKSLKFGRFVVIEMRVDPYEGIAVDQRHILRRYGKQQVTVVRDGAIDYHEVEIGKMYGNMVAIKSGLTEGEEIVIATNRYLRPGIKVNIRGKSPKPKGDS